MTTRLRLPPVPEGHVRIIASHNSKWDIPAENVYLARERDPGLRTLPPDDPDVLVLTREDRIFLRQVKVSSE